MLSGSPFLVCRSFLPLMVLVTLGQLLNHYGPPFSYLKEIRVWHEVGGVTELGIRPEEDRLQATCSVTHTPLLFSLNQEYAEGLQALVMICLQPHSAGVTDGSLPCSAFSMGIGSAAHVPMFAQQGLSPELAPQPHLFFLKKIHNYIFF